MDDFITLKEWAEKNGIDPATARQRAIRGAFETARKIGNLWIIKKDEPLVDHRRKENK
jgi:predicted site-specific integrase-resolvase